MKRKWDCITVRDLVKNNEAEIKTGPFGTQLHASDYVTEGTPVINARNIGFGDIRDQKLEYISEETVNRLSSHLLKPGDIVFGRKGTVERHSFITEKQENWFQGTDCLRLRIISNRIHPRFVSYFLLTDSHKQWIINQSSHGATMTSLNQDTIGRITLPFPPRGVQQRIVSILSAYDDLIENNTRRIQILEEMAQAIYREWFVHFRYPGHEGARLVESELGEIPEGWEIKQFSELVEIDPPTPMNKEDEKPFVDMGGLSTNSMIVSWSEKRKGTSGSKFINRDTLFPRITPCVENGKNGFVQCLPDNTAAIGSTEFIVFREKALPAELIYLISRGDKFRENAIRSMVGASGRQRVRKECFDTYLVTLPQKPVLQKFSEFVEPLFKAVQNLSTKNANLRQQRDLLLPRLVSGELSTDFVADFVTD